MDREKVINEWEVVLGRDPLDAPWDLIDETLTLLKEQDVKNVVNMTLSKDRFLIASCPKCNALLTRVEHKNYCGYCGQAVKWEC